MIQYKKRFLSSFVLFVLFASSLTVLVNAEPSWVMWSKTFGGVDYDQAYSLVKTSDGGYAIAGNTWSFGAGDTDFWLVKTDESGNMEWNQTYGGAGYDSASSLVRTSDEGFALAGQTESFGAGLGDFLLVKTDEIGNMEWSRTYGGVGRDIANSLVQTSDGGYAIAGDTYSFGAGEDDVWLVKTDGSGNMQWNRTYGGGQSDWARSVIQTNDGGYAIAGRTFSFGAGGSSDFWLIKTDGLGNMEWNQTYGGELNDRAYSLIAVSDGGYALAGISESFGTGSYDVWLVKIDDSGNMEWNHTYGGERNDDANSLVETSDGGYALAGGTHSFGHGNNDFWLVKTDGSGNMEWNRFYGEAKNENAYSLVETSDGGFALAGGTESTGAGGSDVWFIRTNEQGVPEFPSWIILPLFLTITSIILIYRKRMKK